MGDFHRHVTVTKGIARRIARHARGKKARGRSEDDVSVVTVRDFPVGCLIGGELVVNSSNVNMPVFGAEWSGGAREKLEKRLRNGGLEKGRVLVGELHCLNSPTAAVCSVCLHIERADEVVITSFDHTRTYTGHRRLLFDAMLRVVEQVACENAKGHPSHVIVDVPKDQAGWYKEFGFKPLRAHPDSKNRRLLAIRHEGCRPKKVTRKKGPRAQQTASR